MNPFEPNIDCLVLFSNTAINTALRKSSLGDGKPIANIVKILSTKTKRDALEFLIKLKSLYSSIAFMAFATEMWKLKIIDMQDLIDLYKLQDQKDGPQAITLNQIFQAAYSVNDNMDAEEVKGKLLVVANEVIQISLTDLSVLFENWFYYGRGSYGIEESFFSYWYSQYLYFEGNGSWRLRSIIAIEYYNLYPKKVTLESVLLRMEMLILNEPDSHGFHRYTSLAFSIAKKNKKRRQKVLDLFIENIIRKIEINSLLTALFDVEFILLEVSLTPLERKNIKEFIMSKIEDHIAMLDDLKIKITAVKK